MDFSWLGNYIGLLFQGAVTTIELLVISTAAGFILAICIALVLVRGGTLTRTIAKSYCIFFRGTPLLVQLWILYYGFGSFLPGIPWIRASVFWPILRDGYFFAALGLTLNWAAYEAEVIRGALLAVPRGELEAARAYGMSEFKLLLRIWLPRALGIALPTIVGEIVLQLKSTPLVFTITVMDLYGVAYRVRQDTFLVYEPLIVATVFYVSLTFVITRGFALLEKRLSFASRPSK
jgi:polar amino acid transport system permease protein